MRIQLTTFQQKNFPIVTKLLVIYFIPLAQFVCDFEHAGAFIKVFEKRNFVQYVELQRLLIFVAFFLVGTFNHNIGDEQ